VVQELQKWNSPVNSLESSAITCPVGSLHLFMVLYINQLISWLVNGSSWSCLTCAEQCASSGNNGWTPTVVTQFFYYLLQSLDINAWTEPRKSNGSFLPIPSNFTKCNNSPMPASD
jgi:hypothetical protein